uniref:Uncharacterized protein n=1 Tax=Strigops habroptila TaxID=2489341 RepID=A0A672TY36_STRHB
MLLTKKDDGRGQGSARQQIITKPSPHHQSCILGLKHILGNLLEVAVTCTKHTKWKIVTAMNTHCLCCETSRVLYVIQAPPNPISSPC